MGGTRDTPRNYQRKGDHRRKRNRSQLSYISIPMEQLAQVAEVLKKTYLPDLVERRAAEQQIASFEREPGFSLLLLKLVCNEECPPEIRLGAAVNFKNFVKKNWGATPEVDISPEEEQQIRNCVLEAMYSNRGNVQNQLSHALHLIAMRDFPLRWPELVPSLTVHLAGENLDHLVATLSAMDQLFKKFRIESKSTELWTELKNCLVNVQEPLTVLYVKMIGFIPNKDQLGDSLQAWLQILNLSSRVFHSLCFQDLPEFFEDNLKPWVEGFLQLLAVQCPTVVSSGGEPTTLDLLKTEICEVFTLYAQKYEEEISSFMQQIIQSVWQLVVDTPGDVRYDGLVCASLDFLSMICQKSYYESYFTAQGVLRTIAQDVCVRNLTLRTEDLELFEDEPIDYLKRDLEGTDIGTRRRGAIDLVRALCRRFEGALVPLLGEIVQNLCSDPSNWQNIDIVYCLVTAMASKGETARSGAVATSQLVDVSDYYLNQVRNHLTAPVNETPVLKADALRYVVTFRNQLRPEILVEAIQAADALLNSERQIIHKYAAHTLEKLLLVKAPGTQVSVLNATNVPISSILGKLVACFDKDPKAQNSPYLIKAILRVVSILDEGTARHGGAIASKLASLVEAAVKNPADSVHTHFLFETMCVLIQKTATLPDGGLDGQLMPLLGTIISQQQEDLIPYALQITGVLMTAAVIRGGSMDAYISFLEHLLKEELWHKTSNVPAALTVLEIYLKHCPQAVLSHGILLSKHYHRLISSKSLDQYGFQLITALLLHIEGLSGVDAPMNFVLNTMFKRIQGSKTPKFIKQFVVFLARFAIVRGARNLAESMQAIQANMYKMVLDKVVAVELPNMKNMVTALDKRILAIGFANILADTSNIISDIYGPLALGVSDLVESPSASDRSALSPEEEQASMYNAEGEFTNPYCRLSYAPKSDPIAPEIANYKGYLAEAILQRGPALNSTVITCITPDLQVRLRSYLGA